MIAELVSGETSAMGAQEGNVPGRSRIWTLGNLQGRQALFSSSYRTDRHLEDENNKMQALPLSYFQCRCKN